MSTYSDLCGGFVQRCATLARVFGMNIIALRRRTDLSQEEAKEGLKVTTCCGCYPLGESWPFVAIYRLISVSLAFYPSLASRVQSGVIHS